MQGNQPQDPQSEEPCGALGCTMPYVQHLYMDCDYVEYVAAEPDTRLWVAEFMGNGKHFGEPE